MPLPVVYHSDYVTPLPPEHRFPMPKFKHIYDLVRMNGIADKIKFYQPSLPKDEWVSAVHTPEYIHTLYNGLLPPKIQKQTGLPWSLELIHRTRTAVGGTILTAQLALEYGLACNTAGGTHHAFPDHGSGFCLLNDLEKKKKMLQTEHLAEKVMIIDLDVHQGDGTAAAFKNNESVFTFSMHCEKNFPFRKQESTLDIALPEKTGDRAYLTSLEKHLPDILNSFEPDFVLYDAGVDPHISDRLGKLALGDNGLRNRDYFVVEQCIRREIPVACVIGGGYDEATVLAKRHTILHHTAADLYQRYLL